MTLQVNNNKVLSLTTYEPCINFLKDKLYQFLQRLYVESKERRLNIKVKKKNKKKIAKFVFAIEIILLLDKVTHFVILF